MKLTARNVGPWVAVLSLLLAQDVSGSCGIGRQGDGNALVSSIEPSTYYVKCMSAIRKHIKLEFDAALQYLLMGAYFSQDDINLEGFSRFFFEHADEERDHGLAFIQYLRQRGDTSVDLFDSIQPILGKSQWPRGGEEALRDALDMEKVVTKAMKELIEVCQNDNTFDYHAADWLTGKWLDEQLEGQNKLAGMINSFSSFRQNHEQLADWMYSNSLLSSGH